MKVFQSVLDLVDNTPLVKLNNIVEPDMATVFAKMETLNPTGSVKDRMAVNMVKRAEEAGLLKSGGTIVESTSGNTGLGLAMAAAAKGYRCIFTIPDKISQEKIDMLKAFGAEVIVTPTDLDHHHPDNYVQDICRPLNGQVTSHHTLDQVQKLFEDNNVAVVVNDGQILGIINKIDLLEFLSEKAYLPNNAGPGPTKGDQR